MLLDKILINFLVSFFPAYFDWVYALMPESKKFKRSCKLVHKFSMDVIKKRRAELDEKKVSAEYILEEIDHHATLHGSCDCKLHHFHLAKYVCYL